MFNRTGDVIFGVSLEQEMEDETKYETSFRTFDAGDYSQIATIETKKSVLNLCSSLDDCHLAVIEQVRTGFFHFYLGQYSTLDNDVSKFNMLIVDGAVLYFNNDV